MSIIIYLFEFQLPMCSLNPEFLIFVLYVNIKVISEVNISKYKFPSCFVSITKNASEINFKMILDIFCSSILSVIIIIIIIIIIVYLPNRIKFQLQDKK
jgi:hypothetical protein